MGGNFDYGRKFIRRIDLGAKAKITDIAGRIETFHSDSMGCNIWDRAYDTNTFRQYSVGTLESMRGTGICCPGYISEISRVCP